MPFLILFAAFLLLAGAVLLYFRFSARIGSDPSGARLERIRSSSNYHDGRFRNVVPTNMDMPPAKMAETMWEFL
jgi:hypothetical protein